MSRKNEEIPRAGFEPPAEIKKIDGEVGSAGDTHFNITAAERRQRDSDTLGMPVKREGIRRDHTSAIPQIAPAEHLRIRVEHFAVHAGSRHTDAVA
jgi:hypothetical protein